MIASQLKLLTLCVLLIPQISIGAQQPVAIRVMTFNIEDVRLDDLSTPVNPRLQRIAETIQRVRPNVLLLNEIETVALDSHPTAADLFVERYLSVPQHEDLDGMSYVTFTPSTNTGIPSGVDLDQSGFAHETPPPRSLRQSQEQRAYAADCFGFGTFPGQYGMALLFDPSLKLDRESIRTFQRFLWKDLPDAGYPTLPDGSPYYSSDAWEVFRLSSKTHAIIPIELPNGARIELLIAHPTPPAFDGSEQRNKRRNHDEIRLIRELIDNQPFLYDDRNQEGGLTPETPFIVLGDLNADPVDGSSIGDPINTFLLDSTRIPDLIPPRSEIPLDGLDPTDSSMFGLRVDYVLPSAELKVLDSGVWRYGWDFEQGFGSDHFPVWVDLLVPSN